MTIDIKPEVKQRLQKEIARLHFHDVDELLTKALDALQKAEAAEAAPSSPKPLRVVDALLSPPFLHSELHIPPRQKDDLAPLKL
jgi:hypothetical protein